MKIILQDQEINLINQILTDFPIKELSKVQQIMKIMESKLEKEEESENSDS
tara:strand:+ start:703 stop:855 length:153 start_codon:yes stop_codon:yes gene_type:complete